METKEVNEFLEAVETALVKNKKEKAQIEIKPIEKVPIISYNFKENEEMFKKIIN